MIPFRDTPPHICPASNRAYPLDSGVAAAVSAARAVAPRAAPISEIRKVLLSQGAYLG